ncbi:MAG: hypothetical protein AB7P03_08090 [Kofleriaceae bacterium]
MRKSLIVAALLSSAALARPASANSCNAYYPYTATTSVPLGCPLVVFVHPGATTDQMLNVFARRGEAIIDVTGETTTTPTELDVWFDEIDENCVETTGYKRLPYTIHEIMLAGVEVGDVLQLEVWGLSPDPTVLPAGPCPPVVAPSGLSCADPVQELESCWMQPDDMVDPAPSDPGDPGDPGDPSEGPGAGGCQTSRGSGGLAGLLIALCGLWSRRKRATADLGARAARRAAD